MSDLIRPKRKKLKSDKEFVPCGFVNGEFLSHSDFSDLKNDYVTEKVSDPDVEIAHTLMKPHDYCNIVVKKLNSEVEVWTLNRQSKWIHV